MTFFTKFYMEWSMRLQGLVEKYCPKASSLCHLLLSSQGVDILGLQGLSPCLHPSEGVG